MISGRPQRIMNDPDGEPLADGWLSKPFTREALEAQVCALLELR